MQLKPQPQRLETGGGVRGGAWGVGGVVGLYSEGCASSLFSTLN